MLSYRVILDVPAELALYLTRLPQERRRDRIWGPARSRAEVAEFFGDFEVLDPGLTEVWNWQLDGSSVINPSEIMTMIGGVARKR
jgi:S-adenosyl methyltransferase